MSDTRRSINGRRRFLWIPLNTRLPTWRGTSRIIVGSKRENKPGNKCCTSASSLSDTRVETTAHNILQHGENRVQQRTTMKICYAAAASFGFSLPPPLVTPSDTVLRCWADPPALAALYIASWNDFGPCWNAVTHPESIWLTPTSRQSMGLSTCHRRKMLFPRKMLF